MSCKRGRSICKCEQVSLLMIFLGILLMLICGCTTYREQFTYYGPGGTNHTVSISHNTFLIFGQAAKLSTETQTEEFIRTVNAQGVSLRTDADAVKAITEGVTEGVLKTINPVP